MVLSVSEGMQGVKDDISIEIRRAWQNLEEARETLQRADQLTRQYRKLLGCGPAELQRPERS